MRQAGRYHSHYRDLKKVNTFELLCKTPELAAEVALGPIKEFDYDDPNNEIGTVMKNVKFIKNQYGKIKDWQYINEK